MIRYLTVEAAALLLTLVDLRDAAPIAAWLLVAGLAGLALIAYGLAHRRELS